jgi:hypothetical protein
MGESGVACWNRLRRCNGGGGNAPPIFFPSNNNLLATELKQAK